MSNTTTLKGRAEWVLERQELARNNDDYLVLKLWVDFYQIDKQFPINTVQDLFKMIRGLPSADDIVRCRRKIQSEGNWLPTDPVVIDMRKRKEKSFPIDVLGYSNPKV